MNQSCTLDPSTANTQRTDDDDAPNDIIVPVLDTVDKSRPSVSTETTGDESVVVVADTGIEPALHPQNSVMMVPPPGQQQHVRVGIGVVVVSPMITTTTTRSNNNSDTTSTSTTSTENGIWVGRRRGSIHGANTLALPGGHLELYESWSDCAIREVQEEMGITLLSSQQRQQQHGLMQVLHVTNDIMTKEGKHYVTIFMIGRYDAEQLNEKRPINCEPHKCDGWELYTLSQLQNMSTSMMMDTTATTPSMTEDTLFLPLHHLLRDNPPLLTQYLSSLE